MDILGAVLAAAVGAAISLTVWQFIRKSLKTQASTRVLMGFSFLRWALSVAYLSGLYLLRNLLPFSLTAVLIGAALGLTLPTILVSLFMAWDMKKKK